MAKQADINDQISLLLERLNLRAKSLIVTVWGDSITPHGGTVWLGSFIKLVESLGLNERVVRTSVYRLQQEEWLTSAQVGRRSYYSLTDAGRRRFDEAARRIYANGQVKWDGKWQLVFSGAIDIDPASKDKLRRELNLLGFGNMAPGVFAHPCPDMVAARNLLQDMGLFDQVVLMTSDSSQTASKAPLQQLAGHSWDIAQLDEEYQKFLDNFRPLWRLLEKAPVMDPAQGFLIRTLLVHDYRRVLLRDPLLPDELLPPDWSGASARLLCRNLYRRVWRGAEKHIMEVLETVDGPLPQVAPLFHERFGGLDENADPREVG